MTNSVDPDQTAPTGAVRSGSTLFASILNSSVMLGHCLQQTTFSDAFLLGFLRVKTFSDGLMSISFLWLGRLWLRLGFSIDCKSQVIFFMSPLCVMFLGCFSVMVRCVG